MPPLITLLLFLPALAAVPAAAEVTVKIQDNTQHKAPQIYVGPKAVKRIGMLAYRWDMTVQQIRKDFENRESTFGGMTKVTWGTYVSEARLSPAVLQAMVNQAYDEFVTALKSGGRDVVGIEQVQQVASYQAVGKAVPPLTDARAWAATNWDVGARGSRSLGPLATGIKMTQDDKLGTALQSESGCDALVFTTLKMMVGQKGRAKVDGVPGIWLEIGFLPDTRVLVGFEQYAAAAEAQGKKVQRLNKMNHVVVVEAKAQNMKVFLPGGTAKEMAGANPDAIGAVYQKHFMEPLMAFMKEYGAKTAAAINAHYPTN